MKKDNVLQQKSYTFALEIIKTYKKLKTAKEYDLARQILRSGTSIGANVEEAIGAQSEKDFFAKLTISYKVARETRYWIRLLRDSNYLEKSEAENLLPKVEELLRIIGSIQITLKKKMNKK